MVAPVSPASEPRVRVTRDAVLSSSVVSAFSNTDRTWVRPRTASDSTWSNRALNSPAVICWVRNSASTAAETRVSSAVMTTVRSWREVRHR